ncbi:MAG: hypothetical protein KDK40_00690 [Chlamydiia bacterium]|nr:hypothetical protein [Chlamydiia bacterium]
MKILIRLALVVCCLTVVGMVFLPTLLSCRLLNKIPLALLGTFTSSEIRADNLSLSWWSGCSVRGAVYRDASGLNTLTLESAETTASLYGLMTGSIGTTTLRGVKLTSQMPTSLAIGKRQCYPQTVTAGFASGQGGQERRWKRLRGELILVDFDWEIREETGERWGIDGRKGSLVFLNGLESPWTLSLDGKSWKNQKEGLGEFHIALKTPSLSLLQALLLDALRNSRLPDTGDEPLEVALNLHAFPTHALDLIAARSKLHLRSDTLGPTLDLSVMGGLNGGAGELTTHIQVPGSQSVFDVQTRWKRERQLQLVAITSTGKELPSAFLASSFAGEATALGQALLGPRFSFTLSGIPSSDGVDLALEASGPQGSLSLGGEITHTTFTPSRAIQLTSLPTNGRWEPLVRLSPKVGKMIRAESPLNVTIPPEQVQFVFGGALRLPLIRIDAPAYTLAGAEIGRMLYDSTPAPQFSQSSLSVAMTPIFLSVNGDQVVIRRMDMLLDQRLPLAFWGETRLDSHKLRLTLGLSDRALKELYGIGGVGANRMLQVSIKGTWEQPKIDEGSFFTRVAAMMAKDQLGALGTLIDHATNEPPPPPTSDVPWLSGGATAYFSSDSSKNTILHSIQKNLKEEVKGVFDLFR